MVNHCELQFAERIMVARRSEMSAEWKVRFAICIASVAIQAFTKLFSFSDALKATNSTFQEVDNIYCLAVGIAVYDEFFSCMCAAEFLCVHLDVFARHTSSRITFLTLTIDSYFCWSPPVILGHTVCLIGPKYIFHTVVDRFSFNEFGYYTVFKNIFDSAI